MFGNGGFDISYLSYCFLFVWGFFFVVLGFL